MGSAASKPTEQVLPTSNPPSPTTTFPLQQVGVKNRNSTPTPSVVPTIQGSAPTAVVVQPRRGEYVALGGSRKKAKSKKSKAKKAKKSKAKKTKSRK